MQNKNDLSSRTGHFVTFTYENLLFPSYFAKLLLVYGLNMMI